MGQAGEWPARDKEEIILGAILVQNTRWENVQLTIAQLRQAFPSSYKDLHTLEPEYLMDLIRPSGFFKNKSKSIQSVLSWLAQFEFDYSRIKSHYGSQLRKQLLSLFGIGEETADVLLLYVFDQPVFIADSYARKLFAHLNLGHYETYKDLKGAVEPFDFSLEEAQKFHYYIDEFGKKVFAKGESFQTSFLGDFRLE